MRAFFGAALIFLAIAASGAASFWIANQIFTALEYKPIVSYPISALVLIILFAVPAFVIYLAVRYRKAITAIFYEEPREFLRYTLKNLPAFTLRTFLGLVKILIAQLALAGFAVGYTVLGFGVIWKWYVAHDIYSVIHDIYSHSKLSYTKIQVLGLVAAAAFAGQLTIGLIRWFAGAVKAFKQRHTAKSKARRELEALRPMNAPHSRVNALMRILFRFVPFGVAKSLRLDRFGKVVVVLALILAAFETLVLRLRGGELLMALGVISAVTFLTLFAGSRKTHTK